MGNGGTVEEGDHSAIAILAMPRESTDKLTGAFTTNTTPVEGGAEMAVGPRSKNPKTAFQKRVSVCLSGMSDIGECTAGLPVDTTVKYR